MKTILSALLLFTLANLSFAQDKVDPKLQEQNAYKAALWGMPIVSFDAMREAYQRDAKAKYNDIVYWSRPADSKLQITTPNNSTLYVYINYNLTNGPVVISVPEAKNIGLFGSMNDAWQVPLADIGPKGEDKGKGGKYLLIPPEYKGDIPVGYINVNALTMNGYAIFRVIPKSFEDKDLKKAVSLIKTVRAYPLAEAVYPPKQRYIDMAGKEFNGLVTYDSSYFTRLSRMINEENVHARDTFAMDQLKTIGIERGKNFTPDTKSEPMLTNAAKKAQQFFMTSATEMNPFFPKSHWLAPDPIGPKTGFSYMEGDKLAIESRGLVFFLACAPPKNLGAASIYVAGFKDNKDQLFMGEKNYRLHVPAKVPVNQYWSATVYDSETAGFIINSPKQTVDSFNQKLAKNADGSVDIYFGPKAPEGKMENWIYTQPGKRWFTFFRFYGPEEAIKNKSWKLPDIENVSTNLMQAEEEKP
ncbi:DUF1254 domain-containing protein [Peredibacter starrii]|uniref:DUF1254 domain-containing protein n=1 Tax=Peredibacter starrii TaxID=28202 RepID=A0AAX4HN53_9BACT|nr:DUF1254 domain-containing protein [Peredibacter starrii]WPU64329.1 DUF1254 domain-containing protein [Peredibacter starrii]